ncbi:MULTISPECIES: TFIIB-type zinc ribbon-containing protein [Actinokineospora]|uniref:TFIIB-type zinc ribbon-containing protein n=1 Tax=Actinokineospora TaxID=39845 RepID=UPI0021642BA7|nr:MULTISPECIES: zf-TFIIB domain-containing protein [Actinokineospora]
MICPKCQSAMRTVDRQGIHIDQCDSCKGIFLDRGELEQILTAEQRYNAAPPPPYQPAPGGYPAQPAAAPAPYPPAPQPGYGQPVYRDSPPGYRDSPPGYGHYGHGGHYKKRRKSFLEELFD